MAAHMDGRTEAGEHRRIWLKYVEYQGKGLLLLSKGQWGR
jgi:hypothetical protein